MKIDSTSKNSVMTGERSLVFIGFVVYFLDEELIERRMRKGNRVAGRIADVRVVR